MKGLEDSNHSNGIFTMENVRVGTALIVVRDKKVLVGKRKGSHAAGLYSFPGGHLDWFETWEECVLRELEEECGDDINVVLKRPMWQTALFVTNDIMEEFEKHYITIFMLADWVKGEAENIEPDKCEGWQWIDYDQLSKLAQHGLCANWIPMDHIKNFRKQIGI